MRSMKITHKLCKKQKDLPNNRQAERNNYLKKTTNELKSIATEISGQFGYFLNVTEVGKVFGISRESARKLVADIPTAELTGSKKYYLYDILKKIYK